MKKDSIYVFLTRGEIHIHDERSLSIHLRPDDKRMKKVSRYVGKDLNFVVINPKLMEYMATTKKFSKENWYLIPSVSYNGSADHSGYTHFSFSYKLEKNYPWEKGVPVRTLTSDEITKFKKEQTI
jgi:hypothetical protein